MLETQPETVVLNGIWYMSDMPNKIEWLFEVVLQVQCIIERNKNNKCI